MCSSKTGRASRRGVALLVPLLALSACGSGHYARAPMLVTASASGGVSAAVGRVAYVPPASVAAPGLAQPSGANGIPAAGEAQSVPVDTTTGGEALSPERYQALPENAFVDARQDALATFSLDVDTASYTLMRRELAQNALPSPASVRVEEYLNFFDYGERASARTSAAAPFSVRTEVAPSLFGAQGTRLLRVAVNAVEIPAAQRPAANLVFLVDVSGSMQSPERLPLVQYALGTLVESLRPDDTVGIVVYAGHDAVLLPPTPVSHRGVLRAAIEGLTAGGSTNGAAGIRTAYDLASQHFRQGGINRVVLCTDGDFNVGLTGDALIRMIEQQRTRGITLSALGFGRGNYNDRDMERLADHGNGNYAFVDSRNEALRVLSRDLASTLQVVAQDVKVQVAFDPRAVRRFRLLGYENRVLAHRDFANDAVDAAEVGSGDAVTALFEYEPAPGAPAGAPLAELRVRWKTPGQSQSHLQAYPVGSQGAASLDAASAPMRLAAAVAEYAEVLRRSSHSEGARFEEVANLAQRASEQLQSEDAREFVTLVRRAATLWPSRAQQSAQR